MKLGGRKRRLAVPQIPLIPADGTAIELGPGGPVWTVRGGKRSPAPADQVVPAQMLWPGAETQIPQAAVRPPRI
jgi:hypothetical protein